MIKTEFMKMLEELDRINEPQEDLQEANKVVSRFANSSRYSGGFQGLSNISTVMTPEEIERKAKEEEERKLQQKRKEFEKVATKAIADDKVPFYNHTHRYEISREEYCPAIDLETNEFIYDPTRKEEILKASEIIVSEKRKAAAAKGLQTRAANLANKQAQPPTYLWTAYYTINGQTAIVVDKVFGNEDPDGACLAIKQKAIQAIKAEAHECRMFKEPFQWDGKLIITITYPNGQDKIYKRYTFSGTKA